MSNRYESSLIERAMRVKPLLLDPVPVRDPPSPPPSPPQDEVSSVAVKAPPPPRKHYSGGDYKGKFFEQARRPTNPFIAYLIGEATWRPGYWLRMLIRRLKK